MNRCYLIRLTSIVVALALGFGALSVAHADEPPYGQLVSLQLGEIHPQSVLVSNGTYDFNYGAGGIDWYLATAGWAASLFRFLGDVAIEENVSFTDFSATSSAGGAGSHSLNLSLIGFDTRMMHSWDWFPWKSLVPFWDLGAQCTLYYQSGASALESAQGYAWNPVAGFGLRLWLNRSASLSSDHVNKFASLPLFLTAKVNRVLPNGGGLDLGGTSYFGGISVGL